MRGLFIGMMTITFTMSCFAYVSVCERTPQIGAAIENELSLRCDVISEANLTSLSQLSVNGQNISSLKLGDFDGLSKISRLDLGSNNLGQLPNGVFEPLVSLKELFIDSNQFTHL